MTESLTLLDGGRRPPRWMVAPLGTHFSERKETVSDSDFAALSVTKNGVVPQLDTAAKTDHGENRKLVRAGDFVINSRSDRKGSAGVAHTDGSVSLVYTVLSPRSTVDVRFAHHLLRSVAFQEEFYRRGNGIVDDLWSTKFSAMKRIELAMPPLREQAVIADFLDRETARIDRLIEKQEKLIETLKERRAAEIRAVVDPPQPPNSWTVGQLRRFARFTTGRTPSDSHGDPFDVDGSVMWIRPENLTAHSTSEKKLSTAGLTQMHVLPAGTTLVCCIGATLGKIGYIEAPAVTNQQITALQSSADGRFLFYKMKALNDQLWKLSVGNTLPILNNERLGNLRVALPPQREQESLAQRLDQRMVEFDGLEARAQRFIDLAKERRAALITAAVTGQIDVREETVG